MGKQLSKNLTEQINMKEIAIIGAGGYGREVACMIRQINEDCPTWDFIGFFDDDPSLSGTSNPYGKVLGSIDSLNAIDRNLSVAIAIGSPTAISNIVGRIINPLIDFPNIIAPSVIFLDREGVKMGKGNIIGTNCALSCNVNIGNFNVFNSYIFVGHDVTVGDCNVIMPSCNVSGGVRMGYRNFMGVKSVILQYISIGNDTRIGAASVVMRNTKDGLLYLGNPAKGIQL